MGPIIRYLSPAIGTLEHSSEGSLVERGTCKHETSLFPEIMLIALENSNTSISYTTELHDQKSFDQTPLRKGAETRKTPPLLRKTPRKPGNCTDYNTLAIADEQQLDLGETVVVPNSDLENE